MGSYGGGSGDSNDSGIGGGNDSSTGSGDNSGGGGGDSGSGAGGGGFSGGWGWGAGSGGNANYSSDSSGSPGGGGGGFSGGGSSGDFSGGGGGGNQNYSSDSSGVGGGGPSSAGSGGDTSGAGGGSGGDATGGGGGGLGGAGAGGDATGLGGAGTTYSSDSSKVGGGGPGDTSGAGLGGSVLGGAGGDTSAVSGAAIGGAGGGGPTTVGFSGAAGDPLSVLDASNDPLAVFDDTNQTVTPSEPAPQNAAAAVDPEATAYGLDQNTNPDQPTLARLTQSNIDTMRDLGFTPGYPAPGGQGVGAPNAPAGTPSDWSLPGGFPWSSPDLTDPNTGMPSIIGPSSAPAGLPEMPGTTVAPMLNQSLQGGLVPNITDNGMGITPSQQSAYQAEVGGMFSTTPLSDQQQSLTGGINPGMFLSGVKDKSISSDSTSGWMTSDPLKTSSFSSSTPSIGAGTSGINLGDPGSPIPSSGLDTGGPDLSELASNVPTTESVSPFDVGVVSNPITSEAPSGAPLPPSAQTGWVSPGSLGDQWTVPEAQVFRSPGQNDATETGDQWNVPEAQVFRSPAPTNTGITTDAPAGTPMPPSAQTGWVAPGSLGDQWNIPDAQNFRVPDNNAQNVADEAQAERANARFSSLPLYANSEWDTINQGNQSAALDDILNPGNQSPLYPGASINSPALSALESAAGPLPANSIVPPTIAGTQKYPWDLGSTPNLNLALPQQGTPVQTTTTPGSTMPGNNAPASGPEAPTTGPENAPSTEPPTGNQPGSAIASNPNWTATSSNPQIASLEAQALGGGFDSLGSLPHNQAQQLSQALVDRLEQNSSPAVQQAISQLSNQQMQEVANDALGQLNQWRQVFLERGIPNPEGDPGWGQVLTQVQTRVSQDILSLTGRQASQSTISQVMAQA